MKGNQFVLVLCLLLQIFFFYINVSGWKYSIISVVGALFLYIGAFFYYLMTVSVSYPVRFANTGIHGWLDLFRRKRIESFPKTKTKVMSKHRRYWKDDLWSKSLFKSTQRKNRCSVGGTTTSWWRNSVSETTEPTVFVPRLLNNMTS